MKVIAVLLLLTVLAGLVRVARGPTRADRMLAAQLVGTAGVAILLLLSDDGGAPGLVDAALVLALLSAVGAITFARLVWRDLGGRPEERDGLA